MPSLYMGGVSPEGGGHGRKGTAGSLAVKVYVEPLSTSFVWVLSKGSSFWTSKVAQRGALGLPAQPLGTRAIWKQTP